MQHYISPSPFPLTELTKYIHNVDIIQFFQNKIINQWTKKCCIQKYSVVYFKKYRKNKPVLIYSYSTNPRQQLTQGFYIIETNCRSPFMRTVYILANTETKKMLKKMFNFRKGAQLESKAQKTCVEAHVIYDL